MSTGSFEGDRGGTQHLRSTRRVARPDWLRREGGYRLLLQFGRIVRHPDFPDVPTARELAPSQSARALIELAEMPLLTMARPFAAPPQVPQDRLEALRSAFLAAHRDPQYLEEAAKLGIYISPVAGEELVRGIAAMAGASPGAAGAFAQAAREPQRRRMSKDAGRRWKFCLWAAQIM